MEEMPKRKAYGFPQEARLKKKSEFDSVFSNGKKGVTRALVIYAKQNKIGINRLGLVVSKKNGNAVKRNRIKRLIREAFRLENPTLPKGFDLVCIPRQPGFPSSTTDLIPLFRQTVLYAADNGAGSAKEPHKDKSPMSSHDQGDHKQ